MANIQTYYIEDGNTIRKEYEAVAAPDYERERKERRQRREHEKQHRRAQVMRRNRLYTVYLTIGVAFFCLFFVGYIRLQNDITTSMNHIASLKTQISDLKAENSATQNRISTTANLSNVKNAAVNQLGMVYANADQIVYYDMNDEDYMSQYSDIP